MLNSSIQSISFLVRWSQWCNAIPKRVSSVAQSLNRMVNRGGRLGWRVPWRSLGIGVSMGLGMAIAPSQPSLPAQSSMAPVPNPFALTSSVPFYLSSSILPSEPLAPVPIGTLRVRNQTYHPIRVALLPQISTSSPIVNISTDSATTPVTVNPGTPPNDRARIADDFKLLSSNQVQYGEPVHWDFVPREGHAEGLVLAVPDGQFWVQPGDIVTAFAQDGSRRYWGPYVIGVTEAPIWDGEKGEWLLVIDTPFPF
ncbi:MAG: hypothetical protein F6K30_07890 [Cyanothece sp. SIO2G6]|nr:hypothetical protein [Cyanothece sp. SIO2G6]